jgi:LmbE family N-acetylglucosaminyl deacetylase
LNVLILAPHADDEVLGCAGAVRRHVVGGDRVTVAVLTNAAVGAPDLYSQESIDHIRGEARKAHGLLGVAATIFEDFPAPRLDQFPLHRLADRVSQIISECAADTLYVPFYADVHVDHRVVFDAAVVASRPVPGQRVRRVYCYETLSETEWAAPTSGNAFLPVRYVNIEGHLEDKLAAMKCFASQVKPFPHPRSLEAIRALAELRGSQCGCRAAEAFWVVREIVD